MSGLNKNKKFQGLIIMVVVLSVMVSSFFIAVNSARAGIPTSIVTSVPNALEWLWKKAVAADKKINEQTWATTYKAGLSYLLNTIAYDAANYLVSGCEGQEPCFVEKGWGTYMLETSWGAGGVMLDQMNEEWNEGADLRQEADQLDAAASDLIEECEEREECVGQIDKLLEEAEKKRREADNKQWLSGSSITGSNLLTQTVGGFKFDFCDPDFDVATRISLGLSQMHEPQAPRCNLKEIKENWEEALSKPSDELLKSLVPLFDPNQNDLGIALKVQLGYHEEMKYQENLNMIELIGKSGLIDKTQGPGTKIGTPSFLIKEMGEITLSKGTTLEETATGSVLADAIGSFAMTLAGKLLQKWFKDMLLSLTDTGKDGSASVYSEEAAPSYGGVEAAKLRFSEFAEPDFVTGGPYEIIAQLTKCPEPGNPGPNECVIDNDFRLAIEQKMTVQEALESQSQLLDSQAVFGFISPGVEPNYKEGYPYRSLVILRKYRIIPVGWEIAAQYINKFSGQSYGLADLVAEYDNPDSPFYRLIDPNWVLKAPEAYCKVQGPGPQALVEYAGGVDANKDGDYDDVTVTSVEEEVDIAPAMIVSRETDYCADEQSCIAENDDGSCRYYGYCTEEQRLWNFSGDSCESYFNTCQSFQDQEGATISYLQNSLDYGNCSIANIGCGWYCREYNVESVDWRCTEPEYLLKECPITTGCPITAEETGLTCTIPYQGVKCTIPACGSLPNLIPDASFEKTDSQWSFAQDNQGGFMLDKSKVYSDSQSLKFQTNALSETRYAYSEIINVNPSTSYRLTGWIFDALNEGRAYINIDGVVTICGLDSDVTLGNNIWEEKSCEFTTTADDTYLRIVLAAYGSSSAPISGSFWFDNLQLIELDPDCAEQDIELTYGLEFAEYSEIYLNSYAPECDSSQEGCHKFIQPQAGAGVNLITNSSFEKFTGLPDDGTNDNFEGFGSVGEALYADAQTGDYALEISNDFKLGVETGYAVRDRTFTFSFYAKDCADGDEFYISGQDKDKGKLENNDSWDRFETTHTFATNAVGSTVTVNINSPACQIDAMQLEEGGDSSTYQDYGSSNNIYLKKAPDYYRCEGYTQPLSSYNDEADPEDSCRDDGYYWRDDIEQCVQSGSTYCDDFALYCQSEEVGCKKYTPTNGDPWLPGIIDSADSCPAECVGYDTFKQVATNFELSEYPLYFIPSTANSCSSAYVGCDEFTNLDEVAAGGEGLEYYSYIRHCQKPEPINNDCETYYTWVGSENTGYQLTTYYLKESSGGGAPAQATSTVPADWGDCSRMDDAMENPECREFYDEDGNIYYEYYRNTVTCSEDCHPYRKTESTSEDCAYSGGDLEAQCAGLNEAVCLELGGVYEAGQCIDISAASCAAESGQWTQSCVYQAIPAESYSCSESTNGCRAYAGDAASNVYTIFTDDLEDGDTKGWLRGNISSEAPEAGGHSIKSESSVYAGKVTSFYCTLESVCTADEGCSCTPVLASESCSVAKDEQSCGVLGDLLIADGIYSLSFWAKAANTNTALDIKLAEANLYFTSLINPTTLEVDPGASDSLDITTNWQSYSLTLEIPETMEVSLAERLVFDSGDAAYWLDNIILKEITDKVYLIKDSWTTPASCDQDQYGAYIPQEMLGCEEYVSSDNLTYYLKSFNGLCSEEAVGCQAVIDTYNTDSAFAKTYNSGYRAEVSVSADEFVYLVVDSAKSCQSDYQGCEALGQPALNQAGEVTSYGTVYGLNNPVSYDTTLCLEDEASCAEYYAGDSYYYFKDPGERICEYHTSKQEGWYRQGSSSSEPDCPVVYSSLGIAFPTVGVCYGGTRDGQGCSDIGATGADGGSCSGDGVCLEENWAGLCPASESGCSEYIEPISDISKNLLWNADFEQNIDKVTEVPDMWYYHNYPDSSSSYAYERQGIAGSYAVKLYWHGLSTYNNQAVQLAANTVYTLSAYARKEAGSGSGYASIKVDNCLDANSEPVDLISPDGSAEISQSDDGGAAMVILAESSASTTEFVPFSGRVVSPVLANCNFRIISEWKGTDPLYWYDNVALRETGIYYYDRESVDETSCNGLVNQEAGCVLFHDRGEMSYKAGESDLSYLYYDADRSPTSAGTPQVSCNNGDYPGLCDSNILLKVEPDRTCGEWLYCETSATVKDDYGQDKAVCLDVGLCRSFDANGNCDAFPVTEQINLIYSPATVESLKNFSGYSKVGYDWGGEKRFDGYYPFNEMEEVGSVVSLENGNFEIATDEGQPYGWNEEGASLWEASSFKVVDDPFEAQTNRVGALEGKNYLRVNYGHEISSGTSEVWGGTEYALAAYLNTINLDKGEAQVAIEIYDAGGAFIEEVTEAALAVGAGSSWTQKVSYFKLADQAAKLKVVLRVSSETTAGSFYYDDIRIRPILVVREAGKNYPADELFPYLTPSCRLYSKADSPACNYIDDNGLEHNGWQGYCLEYDPANPKVCLMWWPTELVRGDYAQGEIYKYYTGRYPLYYCLEMGLAEKRSRYFNAANGCYSRNDYCYWANDEGGEEYPGGKKVQACANNYKMEYIQFDTGCGDVDPDAGCAFWCTSCGPNNTPPNEAVIYGDNTKNTNREKGSALSTGTCAEIMDIPGEYLFSIAGDDYFKYDGILKIDDKPVEELVAYCNKVVEVVTPTGKNKAWMDRIASGSNYLVPGGEEIEIEDDLNYNYYTDYEPFGAILNPTPSNNPYKWSQEQVCSNNTLKNCTDDVDCQERGLCIEGSEDVNKTRICENQYEVALAEKPNKAICKPDGNTTDSETGERYNSDCVSQGECLTLAVPLPVERANTEDFKAPYQVRAGSPYAVSSEEQFKTYETEINASLKAELPSALAGFSVIMAQERIMRLFAQSYGSWQFSFGQCEGGDYNGYNCASDEDCRGDNGWCVGSCTSGQTGEKCYQDSHCDLYTEDNTAPGECKDTDNDGLSECTGNDYTNGDGCSQNSDCQIVKTTGACDFSAGLCQGGGRDNQNCNAVDDCSWSGTSGVCTGGSDISDISETVYRNASHGWDLISSACPNNTRGNFPGDLCAVAPVVFNIKVNGLSTGDVTISSGYVNLTFNSDVDATQAPLTGYAIDWGDGILTTNSGLEIRDKVNENDPHSFNHLYSYWDLVEKANFDAQETEEVYPGLSCSNNECRLSLKVQIRDNWNWCNGSGDSSNSSYQGYYSGACNTNPNAWRSYAGEVIVILEE